MGETICVECAVEEGLHCPECDGCYGDCGEEYCEECGICANCLDICSTHGLCIECAISDGYHCPNCNVCGDEAVICESCVEMCSDCADAFCFNCNLCSDCVEICPDCESCSNCAQICPNCGEHCSECVGICDDCGFCLECCQDIANMNGCDCQEWVCVESPDWNEHFEEYHISADGHSARPSLAWSWNENYHWHACVYCDENVHYTNFQSHTYDDNDKCTVCGHLKNAKIQILMQPRDSKYTPVYGPDEDYNESNIAHFSVEAIGENELTYTWCRKVYSGGEWIYKPLTDPQEGENYEGPDLDILAPEDSCCNQYVYCCLISDEEGNEIKTIDVSLRAKHNYQYYKYYNSHEAAFGEVKSRINGHIVRCVGCGQVTGLRQHVDEDHDYCCDVCDYVRGIFNVDLTVTPPKEGQNPSYTVKSASPAYYAIGSSNNYTQYRRWYMSSDGEDWWEIGVNHQFMSGYHYKFSVDIQTASNREFGTYNGQPAIWASINGNYVLPIKMNGQDAAHYITVEYNFGECNDSVIENITVKNITEPIAGEKPSYEYSILGDGYQRNAAKNAFVDAYWLKTPENWYYIKNGIGWFDLTKSDWIYENETFIPGHEYQAIVYLITEDGYEFAHSKGYEPQVTATVNNYDAEAVTTGSDCTWSQKVESTGMIMKAICCQRMMSLFEGNCIRLKSNLFLRRKMTQTNPNLFLR